VQATLWSKDVKGSLVDQPATKGFEDPFIVLKMLEAFESLILSVDFHESTSRYQPSLWIFRDPKAHEAEQPWSRDFAEFFSPVSFHFSV